MTVNTYTEAYLLGFLYADGCIESSRADKYYTLSMQLAEKDRDFLDNIRKFFNEKLNKTYRLKYQRNTNSYRLTICNVTLVNNLIRLGIIPRKTYENNDYIFKNVPNEYKKYFILGFWDGDGYVSKDKNTRKQNMTGCVSLNNLLLQNLSEYINKEFGENFTKVYKDGKYSRINLKTNKAKKFLDWLYKCKDNLPFILERKYNTYLNFVFQEKAHYGFNNHITKGVYCIETRKYYITSKDASIGEFGSENSHTGIVMVCNGRRKACKNKHFRYLTLKEKEKMKNGVITI